MVIDISYIQNKTQLVRMSFGNNAEWTVGITPIGRAEAALVSTISEIVAVRKSWCDNADLEFNMSLATSRDVSQTRSIHSYSLLIQPTTHLLFTNILQKDAHLGMMSVMMDSEPAGT